MPICSNRTRPPPVAAGSKSCQLAHTVCGKPRNAAALGVADASKSAFLPLVTRDRLPPPPAPRAIDCDAALIGTWTWAPNRIGLEWFLDEVTPRLDRSVRIRIAGQIPAGLRVTHPGVELVGRVADAAEFVRSAAVVPLVSRAGTGVQLKTIEAFELGLPTVAETRLRQQEEERIFRSELRDQAAATSREESFWRGRAL